MKPTKGMMKNSIIISGTALLIAVLGAVVVTDVTGHDAAPLYGFIATTFTVLVVTVYQGKVTSDQNNILSEQMNGKLTARLEVMRDDILASVAEQLAAALPPTDPPPVAEEVTADETPHEVYDSEYRHTV